LIYLFIYLFIGLLLISAIFMTRKDTKKATEEIQYTQTKDKQ
jgi:hypothetical protein